MDDAPTAASRWHVRHAMDEYKQRLRRLAVHDDALLEAIAVDGGSFGRVGHRREDGSAGADRRDLAVDAAPSSFQHAVAYALAAGATPDEIVATLEAVTPVTGAARVVQCAPKIALALGYDVDAALERLDPLTVRDAAVLYAALYDDARRTPRPMTRRCSTFTPWAAFQSSTRLVISKGRGRQGPCPTRPRSRRSTAPGPWSPSEPSSGIVFPLREPRQLIVGAGKRQAASGDLPRRGLG